MNYPKIIDAIIALKSDVKVAVRGTEIIWHDDRGNSIPNPTGITQQQIDDKYAELQSEYDAQDYARKRKAEYPDIYDYMDGIVKNDQTQIDKYIADCQAVKDKYSKGA